MVADEVSYTWNYQYYASRGGIHKGFKAIHDVYLEQIRWRHIHVAVFNFWVRRVHEWANLYKEYSHGSGKERTLGHTSKRISGFLVSIWRNIVLKGLNIRSASEVKGPQAINIDTGFWEAEGSNFGLTIPRAAGEGLSGGIWLKRHKGNFPKLNQTTHRQILRSKEISSTSVFPFECSYCTRE